MTNVTPPTKNHQNQNNELITPEMRDQVVRINQRLDEYAGCLQDLFYNLHDIGDAIFRAQQAAKCLLADDVFGAWKEAKKREQENADGFDLHYEEHESAIELGQKATEPRPEEIKNEFSECKFGLKRAARAGRL